MDISEILYKAGFDLKEIDGNLTIGGYTQISDSLYNCTITYRYSGFIEILTTVNVEIEDSDAHDVRLTFKKAFEKGANKILDFLNEK